MACLALPPLPTLPDISPITLEPPSFSFSGDLTLCCKLLSFSISLPVPIPPLTVNVGVLAAVNATIATINAAIDTLSIKCPRE